MQNRLHTGYDKTQSGKKLELIKKEETLYLLTTLFKTFGDSTRVRILYALSEADLCVGDIAGLLQMSQSAISHQLKVLRRCKLVKFRKHGRSAVYSLADSHVKTILSQGLEHVCE